MAFQPFACEPPTPSSLAHARRFLDETTTFRADLDRKIEAAEAQLAQIIADSRCTIKQLQREREALDEKISRARAYMSPIRRLPSELLRHVFMMNFDEYPCCAWILSSVCLQWRRLALSMPKLWSKVWHPLPSLLSFQVFFVGAFVGLAWPSQEHSPLISPLSLPYSIALSHFPSASAPSPVSQSYLFRFSKKKIVGQTGGCVLHISCTNLPKAGLLAIDCGRRNSVLVPPRWTGSWTQSSFLFR